MTAESVFKYYRAYKFYYGGTYDLQKYHGSPPPAPPLLQQFDRQFYYRIASKASDPQIHALFTLGFFFNPGAHVSEFVTPAAFSSALHFMGRAENGSTQFRSDLYDLTKRLSSLDDMQAWLYGIDDRGSAMPGCLQDVIGGELPVDLACAVLLIPQPHRSYDWLGYWKGQPDTGLGPQPWIRRLTILDQLLYLHRVGWRMMTHDAVTPFWDTISHSLAPRVLQPSLSVF